MVVLPHGQTEGQTVEEAAQEEKQCAGPGVAGHGEPGQGCHRHRGGLGGRPGDAAPTAATVC